MGKKGNRNRSRNKRYNQSSYAKKIATTGQRLSKTRYYLLSEPYENYSVRKNSLNNDKTIYKSKLKELSNVERSKRIIDGMNRNALKKLNARNIVKELSTNNRISDSIKRAYVCTSRKIRREVMFALKNNKKGSGAKSRKIRPESKIKCN